MANAHRKQWDRKNKENEELSEELGGPRDVRELSKQRIRCMLIACIYIPAWQDLVKGRRHRAVLPSGPGMRRKQLLYDTEVVTRKEPRD